MEARAETFAKVVVACFQERMFSAGNTISAEARRLGCVRSTFNDVVQGRRVTPAVIQKMSSDLLSAK